MKRRFLSTLMALVLALSLIPTAALAEETEATTLDTETEQSPVTQDIDENDVAAIGDTGYDT